MTDSTRQSSVNANVLTRDEAEHVPDLPAVVVRDLWMTFPGKGRSEEIQVLERVTLDVRQASSSASSARRGVARPRS